MQFETSSKTTLAMILCVVAFNIHTANAQQTSNGRYVLSQQTFEEQVSANSRRVVRTNPGIGNGIVGTVDRNNRIAISDYLGGRVMTGLELQSDEGLLVTAIDAETPLSVVQADSDRITLGAVGEEILVGPSTDLGIAYTGANPSQDITGVWNGRSETPVSFPITRFGEVGYTPYNLDPEGNPLVYSEIFMQATIEAGSATGLPPDSPANRVDPNDATARFAGVGSLQIVHPTLGQFICSASVIDDNKLLTAAHCFDQDSDGVLDAGILAGSSFFLNDGGSPSATRGLSAAVLHPDFDGFNSSGGHDDLAVVTLDSVLPSGTTKYPIRNTGMSFGEVIEMAGYGISGFGDVPGVEVLPDFNVKRAGKNQAELFVTDDDGGTTEQVFIFDFDGPTGTGFLGGATLGNDVETGVRGGDSGSPAFVDVGGTQAIAGVVGFEFILDGITPQTGEFGVMGGGQMIDNEKWLWIKDNAPGAQLVPEPAGECWGILLALACLVLRRRRASSMRRPRLVLTFSEWFNCLRLELPA